MEENFDPSLDYYDILGVGPDASTDAIRSAYVQLGTNLPISATIYVVVYQFSSVAYDHDIL
jgi:hypothetical protein